MTIDSDPVNKKMPERESRHTARGLIVKEDSVLLMERFRGGLHYFSIPGGKIESGETSEQAVLRELAEETSLVVQLQQQVLIMQESSTQHDIYLCKYNSGTPELAPDAPERHHGDDNVFIPRWVKIQDLAELEFGYWQPLKSSVIAGLKQGFGDKITVVRSA